MSSTLRAVAVACSVAILTAVTATCAVAASAVTAAAPAFTISPVFGQVGTTLTLSGATFTGDTGATINGVAADDFTIVAPTTATLVVPSGATSGPVAVTNGISTVTGPNFLLQQATAGVASLSAPEISYSKKVSVTGTETTTVGASPVVGETAVLYHRAAGTTAWVRAHGTKPEPTGSTGRVRWNVQPSANGSFQIHFRSSPSYAGVTTSAQPLKVQPLVTVNPLHAVPELTDSAIAGSVHPRVTGDVYLQRFVNGAWHHDGHQSLVKGRFSFTITPTTFAALRYRVERHFDGLHAQSFSRTLRLHVVHRELFLGDSGPDVETLLKRLHALHYDTGTVDTEYGDDALHAVTAFEKVQGLPANGEVSTAVWSALNRPKQAHLLHPDASESLAVEVNLTKQILILAKYGKIWKILDTSTAGGYYFTGQDGQQERAVTPTGHFSVQYQVDHTVTSYLGTLYRPSFFTDTGYAIHGEGNGNDGGEVPPYANSHGCVRITDDAVDRYYSLLVPGTSVWIYHT